MFSKKLLALNYVRHHMFVQRRNRNRFYFDADTDTDQKESQTILWDNARY